MNVNETIETETEKPVDINGTITLVKVTETQVKTTAVTLQDNPCEAGKRWCLRPVLIPVVVSVVVQSKKGALVSWSGSGREAAPQNQHRPSADQIARSNPEMAWI